MKSRMVRILGTMVLSTMLTQNSIHVDATFETNKDEKVQKVPSTVEVQGADLPNEKKKDTNNEMDSLISEDVASVLGMDVDEDSTYSLVLGQKANGESVIYKYDKDEKNLLKKHAKKVDEIQEVESVDIDNTDVVDIKDKETIETSQFIGIKEERKIMYAADRTVNIRKEPNIESEKLGEYEVNNEVTVVGEPKEGWYKIDYNGQYAYISEELLSNEKVMLEAVLYGNGPDGSLLDIAEPDPNYTGRVVGLSADDRYILEHLVMGEAGAEGFVGASIVAQTIRDYIVYRGFPTVESVRVACGYEGSLGSEPNEDVKKAVSFIFDQGGCAVKHKIFYFYAFKHTVSNWHETQHFITEYGGHRVFCSWD